MKSEFKGAPCLTSFFPLQMQINICIHTQRVCTSYSATRMCTSLMFLAHLQTFPISSKTWSLQVSQVAERWGQFSTAPNLSNIFNIFLTKRMKRYSLIKKKSCLCLLFTILLFCSSQNKAISQTCSCVKH